MPLSIAILVSGRGSNLQAILNEIAAGKLDVSVKVVIANNPQAAALDIAQKHGVKAVPIASKGLAREQHEELVLNELAKHQIDFVVLAGYMRVLTSAFLKRFRHPEGYFRVINIHPSLLPSFPGANGYEDAYKFGVRLSGVTIHLVDEHVDHGPILAQESFERRLEDTFEAFKARGLSLEHRLYPAVLQEISRNGLKLLAPVQHEIVVSNLAGKGGSQ